MGKRQRARDRNTDRLLPATSIELTEAAFGAAGGGICIATPGWGTSGYYPADVLKRDAAAAFPKGTHMYLDHPTLTEKMDRPERSLRDLAAITSEAGRWNDNGWNGPGVYTRADPLPAYLDVLESMAPHIGVSMRVPGAIEQGEAEGRRGTIIKALGKAHSIDFVTKAGRGGAIQTLLESAGITVDENDDEDLEEGGSVGTWFESRIHSDFTGYADQMYGDGRLTREERIALSSAIGDALDAFTTAVTANAPQLFDRDRWTEPDDTVVTPNMEESAMPLTNEERAELTESFTTSLTTALTPITEQLAEAKKEAEEAKATGVQLAEAMNLTNAREHARLTIDSMGELPPGVRDRALAGTIGNTVPLTEAGAVDLEQIATTARSNVASEIKYLQENGVNFGGLPEHLGGEPSTEISEAELDADIEEAFRGLGLSESAAKTAALGR